MSQAQLWRPPPTAVRSTSAAASPAYRFEEAASLDVQLDNEAHAVDEILQRLSELRARMHRPPVKRRRRQPEMAVQVVRAVPDDPGTVLKLRIGLHRSEIRRLELIGEPAAAVVELVLDIDSSAVLQGHHPTVR